jgi:hypothetical protein
MKNQLLTDRSISASKLKTSPHVDIQSKNSIRSSRIVNSQPIRITSLGLSRPSAPPRNVQILQHKSMPGLSIAPVRVLKGSVRILDVQIEADQRHLKEDNRDLKPKDFKVSSKTIVLVMNGVSLFKEKGYQFPLSNYFDDEPAIGGSSARDRVAAFSVKVASKVLMIIVAAAIDRRTAGAKQFTVLGANGFDFQIEVEVIRLIPSAPKAGRELLNAIAGDLKDFMARGGELRGAWGKLEQKRGSRDVLASLTQPKMNGRAINRGRSL